MANTTVKLTKAQAGIAKAILENDFIYNYDYTLNSLLAMERNGVIVGFEGEVPGVTLYKLSDLGKAAAESLGS